MYIGCHVSISKGLEDATKRAIALDANTFQIFTKNPRGFQAKKVDEVDAKKGRELCAEKEIKVVCHTPYITNLSTPKDDLQEATIRSLVEDLKIAEAYGAFGAVVHCGKHVGEGEDYGIKRMVETLDIILEQYAGPTLLLLENTAGQGSELGMGPNVLMEIREKTKYPEKIAFCFDTCHAFAAGQWNEEMFESFIEDADRIGYLDLIKVIHINDSKVAFNSKKDRHEKIGLGEIGSAALKKFLTHDKFKEIPFILETPVNEEKEYSEEIILLRKLSEDN